MAKFKVAVIVGSNRRESINRKLAQALAKLGAAKADFRVVQIDDLPIYNQDHEADLPKPVVRSRPNSPWRTRCCSSPPSIVARFPRRSRTLSTGARGPGARTRGPARSPRSPALR